MDVVRALIGVHRLEVRRVAHYLELSRDAVPAVHVARNPGDVEGLAAIVALDEADRLWDELARLKSTSYTERRLQPERNLCRHVRELQLDQLVRRERLAELLAVESVLTRRAVAGFRGAHRTPGDAVARAVEAPEWALETLDIW